MRYTEITESTLTELAKTRDLPYGNFTIRYQEMPADNGVYVGIAFHNREKELNTGRIEGGSVEELISQAKASIAELRRAKQNTDMANIKATDVRKSAIDFNTNFTTDVLEGVPTAIRFTTQNGQPVLDVMSREYFEQFSDDVQGLKDSGFRKIHGRQFNRRGGVGTEGYGVNLTPGGVEKLGLDFNGRYTMEEVASGDDMYKRFKLHFDSHVQNKEDRYMLGTPGLTVASWFKKDDQDAAV